MVRIKSRPIKVTPSERTKKPGETHLQYVSRMAQLDHAEATRTEPLITGFTASHGVYELTNVTDSEGGTARTLRNRQMSALSLMHERGYLSEDQLHAAQQIADVAERIERAVSTRAYNMDPRVDCSGRKDAGFETLARVRMEKTYSMWRDSLPMPRRMYIDMVVQDRAWHRLAEKHNTCPKRAKRLLRDALDRWIDFRSRVYDAIEQEDVDRMEAA